MSEKKAVKVSKANILFTFRCLTIISGMGKNFEASLEVNYEEDRLQVKINGIGNSYLADSIDCGIFQVEVNNDFRCGGFFKELCKSNTNNVDACNGW